MPVFFWMIHDAANQEILEINLPLITNTEEMVVDTLTTLTRQFWQAEKIRVDISYFAKSTPQNMRNRPYTALSPTHVVMNSCPGTNDPVGNWLELLYHESSHHLIGTVSGFIGGTIRDVADASGERSPFGLWHAYLFYFSGKATQKALASQGIEDYEIYMIRNKVFSRLIPHVVAHLPEYMHRRQTLKDVTARINQSPEIQPGIAENLLENRHYVNDN